MTDNHPALLRYGTDRSRILSLVLVAFSICLIGPGLSAQTDTGSIAGTATDSTGAVVLGASVTAANVGNGLKLGAVTNASGEFKILAVPRGDYTVTITAKGFQSQSATVTVTVTTEQTVAFVLSPAGSATTVEVTAAAPLVNTSDATIGSTIQGEQVPSFRSTAAISLSLHC